MPARNTKPFYFVLLLVLGSFLSFGVCLATAQPASESVRQKCAGSDHHATASCKHRPKPALYL